MFDWEPIETAPTDGTQILAGRFTGKPHEHEGFMAIDWYRTNRRKHGYIGFGRFNATYWPATHWQPLPPPPTETLDKEKSGGN